MRIHATPSLHLPPTNGGGFSLVELSIVLVILGLLAGGILAGQSLIKAAELRSVSTEVTRYTTAVHSFRDRYRGLPGDLHNATDFWGALDGGDGLEADCGAIESTGHETCNGNGDGFIYTTLQHGMHEKLRAWQHLANAGLVEGKYTGAPNADGKAFVGVAFAASKLTPMGYEMHLASTIYRATGRNLLKLGTHIASETTGLNGAALTPEQAWGVDTKLDDGRSDSGKWLARDAADVAGCVTNGIAITRATYGSYILANRFKACRIYYFAGF